MASRSFCLCARMTESPLHFYYRNGCHLCEELAALLHRGWPAVFGQLQWRDVDEREQWRSAYGDKVPVLEENGIVISELLPDSDKLQEHFGKPLISL